MASFTKPALSLGRLDTRCRNGPFRASREGRDPYGGAARVAAGYGERGALRR